METNKDIIIIGGGIIGLACAHYLLQNNASVRIIEQDVIESGTSSKNCGLLHFGGIIPLCAPGVIKNEIIRTIQRKSPLHIKPSLDINFIKWLFKFVSHCNLSHMNRASTAKNNLLQFSLDLFDSLFKEYSLECDFRHKGFLLLFKDKKYFKDYNSTIIFLKKYGFNLKKYEQVQVRELEPTVKKEVVGAWHDKHDRHIRPAMLVKAWKNLLIKKGLIIEEKCKLIDFGIHKNKIQYVNTIRGQFKADHFILAAGAWTSQISRQLKLNIPVQPGKGYSITMAKPDFSPEIPCMLYEKNMVITPWKSGLRLGGTMEFSGFDDSLNKKRLAQLIHGAKEYLNIEINNSTMEQWSGFRPMTHDDLPIIDRSYMHDNLFVATGHGMLGVTMATGTGKAICDMIYEKKSQIDISPFSLKRF